MKTQTETKDKLTKVYNLAVSQCNANEAEVAKAKLHILCKKYKLRLKDYVFHSILDIDYSEKKAVNVSQKRKSRRSLIIMYVQQNSFTTLSLAKLLKDKHNYNDIKANKKAIAGTLYDMLKNDKFKKVIRHENNVIEIVV